MGAVADLAAGETINGTVEAGTIDTLRLNAAGTYNLSTFTTITNIDAIALCERRRLQPDGGEQPGVDGRLYRTASESRLSDRGAAGDDQCRDDQRRRPDRRQQIVVVGTNLGGADTITGGAAADRNQRRRGQ